MNEAAAELINTKATGLLSLFIVLVKQANRTPIRKVPLNGMIGISKAKSRADGIDLLSKS